MTAEEILPSPSDFIKHEADTLQFLRDSPFMQGWHTKFATDSGQLSAKLRSGLRSFDFHSMLDFDHESKTLRVFLTGLLARRGKEQYEMASYCVTVCERDNDKLNLLRKMHFDVATTSGGNSKSRSRKPICHLQSTGQLFAFLTEQGLTETHIQPFHPWLSEPRIFLWPACTAILLEMILHEFQHRDSKTFREQPEWRDIIWKSEQLLLKNYYRKCFEVLDNKRKEKKVLADVLYAE